VRGRAVVVIAVLAILATPACSRISRHFGGGSTPTRKGTLTVTPPSGTVGTAFSLSAGGFKPGEPMTFEVDVPNRPRFVGPSHTADPGGAVSSKYTPQNGDPPGTYVVKAVGSQGTRAQGQIVVSAS
jgi:hypothetical protein